MGRVAILIVVSLLLAGCGKHYWGKPGAGFPEFSQDNRECAQQHAFLMGGSKDYGIVSPDLYRACLRSRGWTRAQQQDPPPAGWFRGIESDEVVKLDAPPLQPEPAPASREDPYARRHR
ncbi:MAG: hypothetical protein AUH81_16585 [Candidatus Rokubacteria bacterium 13_1_40CM_4_69_5]|nr:MAG: hypothetical protein AUH81_16585 [Candidatus Rokubacteria bacterium 13_1_40CM_4_69_5]